MSWAKKRGQANATPPTQPPQVPMYNPNQHSSFEYQQDNWYNQAPKQETSTWQPQYQQNYSQDFTNYYQNQQYGNLQYNQQYQNNAQPQPQSETDGWASNWGWGDEDNSNIQTPSTTNVVTESFANDETWNWGSDDPQRVPDNLDPTKIQPIDALATKRNKLETPQWSLESQVSQESSDDIQHTSESDKSRMLSRSSTISHSPISGHDPEPQLEQAHTANFENKENLDERNPFKRKVRTVFPTQSVNLETLPDNAEQPDSVPTPARKITPTTTSHPFSENNEAPINDRNQYLETAQLSDVDVNNYVQINDVQDDTMPPPGLRRMIPGQTVASEPPEGLRRMIPGESSSPEATVRDAEPEQREATIGADTPTGVNRSETIGADMDDSQVRRRDSVEGQIQDEAVSGLVSGVRNLAVDEGNGGDGSGRRGESSESDREGRGKSPRYVRDRDNSRERDRYRDRNRSRYSPDDYNRDKKYDRRHYKDRRFEEDTDYYSDKDRERRNRDGREYDRKYNSLRKEKEKDKERRRRDDRGERREYGRDSRKNDYYYGRYEDDFENESRSRASSRSDSVHDSYRDRDRGHDRDRRDRRHREKDRHRRHRDPFNPYMPQGFGYDMMYSQYYQQYQYYENLRKTNPQAYAQLYRKYYQDHSGETPYGTEDRASVHSGRSSANDELSKDRYTRQSYYSQTSLPQMGGYYRGSQTHSISGHYGLDDSSFVRTLDQTDASLNYEESQLTAQRLTPAKFATAHIKASISSGKLVRILPHYPLDGQTATVELCNLESLLYSDEDYQELKRFPGPLVKGVTHKKTIIEYCENKIKGALLSTEIDKESYILMWELLILLIRQNGMVVGADIAELLLKNHPQDVAQRPPSVVSSVNSNIAESQNDDINSGSTTNLKEEEVTNRFREYLLYGSGKEALEWAMTHGLWGHALFLASKLDKRTYANVMMRFANGLTMNDPLQTLYQLLSGRTPAAVTCVADEKWGDWRPHLAMILSNSTQRPDLNCKAITILGDTLMSRGSLYAAQFCYLMAEVTFSQYGASDAKLVLLGANHNTPFSHFATNEAIHMTEIYEYARSLNDDQFGLVNFQLYKYVLATRLADVGLLEKALSYLEKIGVFIVKNPNSVEANLVNDVTSLADRLKYYDPVGDGEVDGDCDSSRVENSWLKDLRKVQNDLNSGVIAQSPTVVEPNYPQNQDAWQQQQFDPYQQQQWSAESLSSTQIEEPQPDLQQQQPETQYQEQQQYWSGQTWGAPEAPSMSYQQEPELQQSYNYGAVAQTEPDQVEKKPTEDIPQPQISLPNQRQDEKQDSIQSEPIKHQEAKTKQPENLGDDKSGNGWFGGIFSKLSLKPKNQMKLPDDKNPTILWDSEKKKWVNTDGDNADEGSNFKPPPKLTEMIPKPQPTVPKINPEALQENGTVRNQPNMFKLQKNRNLKKSYIDVFNPNSQSGSASLPPPQPIGGIGSQPMNFFVPQQIHDPSAPTDFLTPAPSMSFDENSQMSRWSSASSLSREVQSYTLHKPILRR